MIIKIVTVKDLLDSTQTTEVWKAKMKRGVFRDFVVDLPNSIILDQLVAGKRLRVELELE